MNRHINYILLAAMLSMAACQKKDTTPADPAKVTINITSPMEGRTYHTGDTIQLNADFSYVSEIHAVAVSIADSASGETLYDEDQDLHTDHFVWQRYWVDTCTQPAVLVLTFTAVINDEGLAKEQEVYVLSQP